MPWQSHERTHADEWISLLWSKLFSRLKALEKKITFNKTLLQSTFSTCAVQLNSSQRNLHGKMRWLIEFLAPYIFYFFLLYFCFVNSCCFQWFVEWHWWRSGTCLYFRTYLWWFNQRSVIALRISDFHNWERDMENNAWLQKPSLD